MKENLNYKEASERLEQIVRYIEQESPDVDELTKLVAEAVKLSKFCTEKLNKADKQLETLIAQLDESLETEE